MISTKAFFAPLKNKGNHVKIPLMTCKRKDMKNNNKLGSYKICNVAGERYKAFSPPDLPPAPSIDLARIQHLIIDASKALGRLDGLTTVLPDSHIFLYYYIRKEAVLSSQIEGTQSSLSDLLFY